MTWRIAREHKIRNQKDIAKLDDKEQIKFKMKVHSIVKELFNKRMDKNIMVNGQKQQITVNIQKKNLKILSIIHMRLL